MIYDCPHCKRELVKNIVAYLKKYPDETWMHCCYCGWLIKISKIKEDMEKDKNDEQNE